MRKQEIKFVDRRLTFLFLNILIHLQMKRDQLLLKEIIPSVVQVYDSLLTNNKKAPQTTRALTGNCEQSNSFILLSFEKIFPTQKKKEDSIIGIAQSVPNLPTITELTIPESGVE